MGSGTLNLGLPASEAKALQLRCIVGPYSSMFQRTLNNNYNRCENLYKWTEWTYYILTKFINGKSKNDTKYLKLNNFKKQKKPFNHMK